MPRTNLAIPFFLKDKLKPHGIKWDITSKTWYWEEKKEDDEMPDILSKYIETDVDITYEEKDEYKAQFTSLRFDRPRKTWVCSAEDYNRICEYRK